MVKSKNREARTLDGLHKIIFMNIPTSCTTFPYCVVSRAESPNKPSGIRDQSSHRSAQVSPKRALCCQYSRTCSAGTDSFAGPNKKLTMECGSRKGHFSLLNLISPSFKSLYRTGISICCISSWCSERGRMKPKVIRNTTEIQVTKTKVPNKKQNITQVQESGPPLKFRHQSLIVPATGTTQSPSCWMCNLLTVLGSTWWSGLKWQIWFKTQTD